jgi:hypothetical protein
VVTAAANQDITLSPTGTGRLLSTADFQLQAQADLRFGDSDSSNWVAFQAPAIVSSNITWTLPAADGTNNQVLTTNGSGTLSWSSKDIAISDQTSSATIHYVTLSTSTSGIATTLNTSSTKLSFQPSTGALTLPIVTGGTGASNTLTLRSTSNATKGRVIIDETTPSTTTTSGALTVGGGVGIAGQLTAATIVETSSIAFKENVNPIVNALDSIMQLVGVTYARKDTQKYEAGLIAEEVNKVLPDLVSKDDNGDPHGIQYTKLTAYLIEAVKSLKAEIDHLKSIK